MSNEIKLIEVHKIDAVYMGLRYNCTLHFENNKSANLDIETIIHPLDDYIPIDFISSNMTIFNNWFNNPAFHNIWDDIKTNTKRHFFCCYTQVQGCTLNFHSLNVIII
jgi:hypothetical protein